MTEQEQFYTALVRAMARRCGLECPDAFATKTEAARQRRVAEAEAMYGSGNVISTPNGRTGRTTRILLRALVALSSGCEVEVVAADKASAYAMAEQIEALRARSGAVDQGTLRYGLRVSWIGQGAQTERNIDVRLVDHACEQAFLVQVGFTPEQADDCTSGDIDRNGAASMLPGIIEALERHGVKPFTDDELLELGIHAVTLAGITRASVLAATRSDRWDLTALKLLARAREAEQERDEASQCADLATGAEVSAKLELAEVKTKLELAEAEARGLRLHIERMSPGPETADRAAVRALIRDGAALVMGRAEALETAPLIDPTVAALAVVDDLEASGVVKIVPVDLAERLAKVIGSVAHRDVKPENPFPQWCAFETDPRSETAFHGPRDTKALAEAEAEALRAEGHAVDVRRCRRVTVTDDLVRWVAEQLVEHVNEDTSVLTDVDGAMCYGDWESEIASLRDALDARVEIKLWIIEPEGAAP